MSTSPPRLIGMVHLGPLPGSPRAQPLLRTLAAALRDADVLMDAGFDGVVVENFGDAPFHKDRVEPITVAAMSRIAAALVERLAGAPLTVNVLRNDARAALAVACAAGAASIRVNVHSGARITDQGLIQGRAAETLRLREASGAGGVAIWADVAVKHSAPVGQPRPIEEEAAELVGRAGAEAVIVSGAATGATVDPARLAAVARGVGATPVLVGSGATAASVAALLEHASGVIVGTSVKVDGVTTAPVDPSRARALVIAAGR